MILCQMKSREDKDSNVISMCSPGAAPLDDKWEVLTATHMNSLERLRRKKRNESNFHGGDNKQ